MKKLIGRILCAIGLHDDNHHAEMYSTPIYICSRCGHPHY